MENYFQYVRCNSIRTSAEYYTSAQVTDNPVMKQGLTGSMQYHMQAFKLLWKTSSLCTECEKTHQAHPNLSPLLRYIEHLYIY